MAISNITYGPADQAQPQATPAPAHSQRSALAAPANDTVYATDPRGRRIGCKKLSAIDLFDLTCLMGEHSSNKSALNQAMVAASVVDIDGVHQPRPSNMITLRARISLLDFDGFLAVSDALTAAAAANTAADVNLDAVKN